MRLGVIADIHGNSAALDAVMGDAEALGVERWWALGDLVLFGPRPVEVLETLGGLPGVEYVSGNTDRYVVTGEQPAPHATAADAAGDVRLVARYGSMAGAIGWTRGALAQAGLLHIIAELPSRQSTLLPDGSTLLGIHASPGRDHGPGIDNQSSQEALVDLLSDQDASTVVGGHTHDPTDRVVGEVRALNPGSVGLPHRSGWASWMLIDAHETGIRIDLRQVPFDVGSVVEDLHGRGYPSASFLESVLTGARVLGQ